MLSSVMNPCFANLNHNRRVRIIQFDNERCSPICTKKVLQHNAQVVLRKDVFLDLV